jgi:hypothetical protein
MGKVRRLTPEERARQLENQRRLEEIIRQRKIVDARLRAEREKKSS